LFTGFGGDAFATAVLAELDTDTGRLEWVSAGHPEPLLLRDGRLIKSLSIESALPLGLGHLNAKPPATFAVGTQQLQPGDRVLFYTDGVIEADPPTVSFRHRPAG
jgi:sigma-B regulation protein RsbU (phosphoserine phosphatase)